ncbi:MAG: beta-ketoacyl synthase N-terminal-like domain-containing protein [Planctomycetaceae bacterium]
MAATKEVVITGVGLVTPLGIGRNAFWTSLSEGRTGLKKMQLLSWNACPGLICGEVSDFNDETAKKEHLKSLRKSLKVMCREIQTGVASALQAMEDAGLKAGSIPSDRIGCDFGANLMSSPPEVVQDSAVKSISNRTGVLAFDYDMWGQVGMKGLEPLWLLKYLPNMPGCHIGIALEAHGPNNSITHDEASGGLVIGEACNAIRRNRADVMIAGVTGTRIHPVKAAHSAHWDVLADGPADSRVRPFDNLRSGEALAEAACSLILESREHAEARGAKILGTILSCGASSVSSKDGHPDEAAAIRVASEAALQRAGITAADLGHINACASGHPHRDRYEAQGLRQLLGSAADSVPVTAIKSYTGSAGSGSSIMELAASLLALQHGVIPKTLNYTLPDAEAPLNVVHGEHRPTSNGLFLKTSVTRMGQASAVVVKV